MIDPTKQAWHHEYYHLQTIVTGYNTDCLTIKNWSVTVAAAAIGYAYVDKTPALLIVSAAGALCFLLTEAYWRANQFVFIKHIREIERNKDDTTMKSPTLSTQWKVDWGEETFFNNLGHVIKSAVQMRTWLPHAFVIVAAFVLFRYYPPEAKTPTPSDHGASIEVNHSEKYESAEPGKSPHRDGGRRR